MTRSKPNRAASRREGAPVAYGGKGKHRKQASPIVVLAAVGLVLTMALAAYVAWGTQPGSHIEPARPLRECVAEDGPPPCVWLSWERGNRDGAWPFVVVTRP